LNSADFLSSLSLTFATERSVGFLSTSSSERSLGQSNHKYVFFCLSKYFWLQCEETIDFAINSLSAFPFIEKRSATCEDTVLMRFNEVVYSLVGKKTRKRKMIDKIRSTVKHRRNDWALVRRSL